MSLDDVFGEPRVELSEVLNHILDKGVVLKGEVMLAVADIDLRIGRHGNGDIRGRQSAALIVVEGKRQNAPSSRKPSARALSRMRSAVSVPCTCERSIDTSVALQ